MEWTDLGLVMGTRPLGESGTVVEIMTRDHGRHLGLVHGGRSRRMRPVLQPGNLVHAVWRARLDEQLGSFTVEGESLGAARLLGSALALCALGTLAAHLRCLAERDPHPALFDAARDLVEHLDDPAVAPALVVRFELVLLAELGFGLDLTECAATGLRDDLVYVSPRSGRAVSRAAGEPYRAKLMALPPFLRDPASGGPSPSELADGFRVTGFFLDTHVYGPVGRGLPDERARFASQVASQQAASIPSRPPSGTQAPGTRTDSERDGTA